MSSKRPQLEEVVVDGFRFRCGKALDDVLIVIKRDRRKLEAEQQVTGEAPRKRKTSDALVRAGSRVKRRVRQSSSGSDSKSPKRGDNVSASPRSSRRSSKLVADTSPLTSTDRPSRPPRRAKELSRERLAKTVAEEDKSEDDDSLDDEQETSANFVPATTSIQHRPPTPPSSPEPAPKPTKAKKRTKSRLVVRSSEEEQIVHVPSVKEVKPEAAETSRHSYQPKASADEPPKKSKTRPSSGTKSVDVTTSSSGPVSSARRVVKRTATSDESRTKSRSHMSRHPSVAYPPRRDFSHMHVPRQAGRGSTASAGSFLSNPAMPPKRHHLRRMRLAPVWIAWQIHVDKNREEEQERQLEAEVPPLITRNEAAQRYGISYTYTPPSTYTHPDLPGAYYGQGMTSYYQSHHMYAAPPAPAPPPPPPPPLTYAAQPARQPQAFMNVPSYPFSIVGPAVPISPPQYVGKSVSLYKSDGRPWESR